MHSLRDPQTPLNWASRATENFTNTHQHFVALPGAAHSTLSQSPTYSGIPCGLDISASFLMDPKSEPRLYCLDDLMPIARENAPDLRADNPLVLHQKDLHHR